MVFSPFNIEKGSVLIGSINFSLQRFFVTKDEWFAFYIHTVLIFNNQLVVMELLLSITYSWDILQHSTRQLFIVLIHLYNDSDEKKIHIV